MIYFKRHIVHLAIRTTVVPLFEDVGPCFPSGKGSALVLCSRNLWVLQRLRVKSDSLNLDACQGSEVCEPGCPGNNITHPRKQGWRQPSTLLPPVVEARSPVTQMGGSASSPGIPLGHFVFMHLLAPMLYFREKDRMMDFSFFCLLYAGNGDPTGLAPRINFESERLQDGVFHPPIFHPNGERCHTMDDGTATLE